MLYYLSQWLLKTAAGTAWADRLSALRLFSYITFRCAGAAITALLLSLWLGPKVIAWLKQLKFGQEYTDKAEEAGGLGARVLSKKGTPTMGGILIILALNLTAMLWARWNTQIELTLLSVFVLTGLGFYDDYAKITQQTSGGTRADVKLWVQTALALFVAIYLRWLPATSRLKLPDRIVVSNLVTTLMLPFDKHPVAVGAVAGILITSCWRLWAARTR